MTPDHSPAEEYREIAGRFSALVEGVPDDDIWSSPSPVEGWAARDIVRHLVDWFPGFLESGTGIRLPGGPPVDDDPAAAWRTFSDAVQALLDDPATTDVVFSHVHTGELPLPVAVSRFLTADVFMHSWDLARATGQDDTLDPVRCAAMLAGMEPVEELMRYSGQYGPRVEVPDDADVQTRFLAFIGRHP
ncbi:MAG: TIGR03086 family metal-binding protein [Dermatophilaceae bacterium]